MKEKRLPLSVANWRKKRKKGRRGGCETDLPAGRGADRRPSSSSSNAALARIRLQSDPAAGNRWVADPVAADLSCKLDCIGRRAANER